MGVKYATKNRSQTGNSGKISFKPISSEIPGQKKP